MAHAQSMAAEGADFIDIGAQPTRPGAKRLSPKEKLSCLVTVLEAMSVDPTLKGVKLSVDTFDSRCAYNFNLRSSLKPATFSTFQAILLPLSCNYFTSLLTGFMCEGHHIAGSCNRIWTC